MARARIPHRIKILHYVLVIKQVPMRHLKEIAKEDRQLDGMWDDATRTIYIWNRLSIQEKRQILLHELAHALVDITEWERAPDIE